MAWPLPFRHHDSADFKLTSEIAKFKIGSLMTEKEDLISQ